MKKSVITAVAAIGMVAISLVGCSSNDDVQANAITVTDPYVKAASMEPMEMDSGMDADAKDDMAMDDMAMDEMEPMSAAFMSITNSTGAEVKLVGGSTEASKTVEIHEVVDGVMRPIDGGLVIAEGETSALKPGGNHVMLMGLKQDLKVGDEVSLTLEFSNGEKIVVTAPVKEIPAADEPYASATPTATKQP